MNKTSTNSSNLKKQTTDAYDYLSERYKDQWANKIDEQIAHRFLDLVTPHSTVLDVGCGPGHYSRYFETHNLKMFGIDLSAGMLSQAQSVWREDRIARMDIQKLGFPSSTFDALWVCASFIHVPYDEANLVLGELKRVLKKDTGILFINVITGNKIERVETAEEMGTYGKPGRFFQWYPDLKDFESMLCVSGFTVLEVLKRSVKSQVVEKAKHKENLWVNFYCKV